MLVEEPTDLLKNLWDQFEFIPDENQKKAILHLNGPLYLPAAPGSGKTRVLLWRTVNLIVTHGIPLDQIFLSTFTEKAAKQLRDGLRTLLTAASQKNGVSYDFGKLYVGTIHSLCRKLLSERRLSIPGHHSSRPILLDELGQYLFVRRKSNWDKLMDIPNDGHVTNTEINRIFGGRGKSRHNAITNLVSFFNRLSEEMVDPQAIMKTVTNPDLKILIELYSRYLELLSNAGGAKYTDLSLLQKVTVDFLESSSTSTTLFSHVIIDEYQDTNSVQEKLFFKLAKGTTNLCVVGDDDQALYRFRGATVENFVDFQDRCVKFLGVTPRRLDLTINYRSCNSIVEYAGKFINHSSCNWMRGDRKGAYRVMDKVVGHDRECPGVEVVYSSPNDPESVASEIAYLVRDIIDKGKVTDPNQIAFLFPSLKSPQVWRMRSALMEVGLKVYAPRAGTFLNVDESVEVFGAILLLFDEIDHHHDGFLGWIENALQKGRELTEDDPRLKAFIETKRTEMKTAENDFKALINTLHRRGWSETDPYNPDLMEATLTNASGIYYKAKKALQSRHFNAASKKRLEIKKPFNLKYVITRAASVDWNFLDIFYQLCGFAHFKKYFDDAERSVDEGPICNLSLISQYISRYHDEYPGIISGRSIDKGLPKMAFVNFLYVLYRREEFEYEDEEDPFPKGRVPFITIHQAKGLEFPVVVLANPRKNWRELQMEKMISKILPKIGEPLDKMPLFDMMRMFYVALSRAKNLLVIPNFTGQGQSMNEPFRDLMQGKPRIPKFNISALEVATSDDKELPQSYSYTADFQLYQKCPRQYMIFRQYNFVPSRTQTMFFGSLVHQTLDDLHQLLIRGKSTSA